MGGKIIAGVIGFVVLVLLIQTYILNDDDGGPGTVGRGGAAPTATLPAQTPVAISLGESQGGAGSTGSSSGGGGTYVVKDGDTLGSIAAGFNVAPEAQAAWIAEVLELNGMADARLLQAGQELQVPAVPPSASGTPTGATGATGATGSGGIEVATATPEAGGGDGDVYVVESGDTPLDIAAKFCVENPTAWVNELVALNGIDASNLGVGDELELPTGTPGC